MSNISYGQGALINKGTVWKYFDEGTEPAPINDIRWYERDFDDSSWSEGPGQLGYGDGDESTLVKNDIITLYLRKSFEVTDVSAYGDLIMDLIYDDGAIIYLNGSEILRKNMSPATSSYSTYALSVSQENAQSRDRITRALLPGKNVISAEIHQESNTSSDISFDLSLGPFIRNLGFTESPLPLLFVNTENNRSIIDEPKIPATLKIVFNEDGTLNDVNSIDFHFEGNIGIELRGQSSLALFPKKGFGIETRDDSGQNLNVSILGLPEENDWVIHSPYSDKSLIRNVLAYHLAGQIMSYAPRVRLCELIINDEYYGIVVLTEKIKRDKNRVAISKLNPDEIDGDDLTGGYILKFDKGESFEVGWSSPHLPIAGRFTQTDFLYHYPKPQEISNPQKTYIRDFITDFESILKSNQFADRSNGYRKYINVNSFIDLMIINEVSRNVDGYRLSTYMYKDKDSEGGKLNMGPVWDYNLAFGNANYCNGDKTWNWAHGFNQVCPDDMWANHFWWQRLLSDEAFKQEFKDRYFYFRKNILSNGNIMSTIDSLTNQMGPAVQRNFTRWQVLGTHIWPNNFVGNTYNSEIDYLKSWIADRLAWLDNNIKSLTTSVEEIGQDSPIQISPNPVRDKITFRVKDNTQFEQISIYSVHGNLISKIPFQTELSTHSLPVNGIYIIHIIDQGGLIYINKVILNR